MVRPHMDTSLLSWFRLSQLVDNPDTFLIDEHEVSNKEYKAFIEAGGYKDPKYWREPFIVNGKEISWREAMTYFVDQTGRPGPSSWMSSDLPPGEENYPVGGVSWYEAAAYAEFVDKQLPSLYHMKYLAGTWAIREISQRSNLNSTRTTPVSGTTSQNLWGVRDLFGNVREWCYNRRNDNFRSIVGGSYDDQDYLANNF